MLTQEELAGEIYHTRIPRIPNYRPVSLLPALSKILEKAICQQLMAYFQKYNLLCSHQYGFRAKNQTTHVVHSMLNSISKNMTEGRCTIASFIDLSKAFDCLQYDKLFTKMRYIGFTDNTVKWFQDCLTNRQQVVDVDSTVSDPMQLGVPQGSVLGPILFLIYVNDINNCDNTTEFVKFADDTTIITTGASLQEATDKMNASLDRVAKWFLCNKLNLNPSKTRYIIFNSNTNLSLIHI